MLDLDGIWRLTDSRAWDAAGVPQPKPYGDRPLGQLAFDRGRMICALCNGDPGLTGGRGYSSYGGPYDFDGETLTTHVEMASEHERIGGQQVRRIERVNDDTIVLHPPARAYEGAVARRELVWQRVWRPTPA